MNPLSSGPVNPGHQRISGQGQSFRSGRWSGPLPAHYSKTELPAGVVLRTAGRSRPNWSIRMAARAVMARDNMLSISRVPDAFNGILPPARKLWISVLPTYLARERRRFTGPRTASQVSALSGQRKSKAEKDAVAAVLRRIGSIIQIRHDWIHNCGRPRTAIAAYTDGEARARIADLKAFVVGLDDHVERNRIV